MRTPVINDNKPSGRTTAPGATRTRLALGIAWFLVCAYLGSQLLVGAATSYFRLISISLPFIILLWVFLFFFGRWFLGRLADGLTSQLATKATIEVVKKASAPAATLPRVETGQVVGRRRSPFGSSNLPPSTFLAQISDIQFAGISLTPVSETLGAPSNLNLESIPLENTNFADVFDVYALQPSELVARSKTQMESPTIATETSAYLARHFATAANAWYVGHLVRHPKSFHCLRVGRTTMATVPVGVQFGFGPVRLQSAPTIGVPQRDFIPESPGLPKTALHPQA